MNQYNQSLHKHYIRRLISKHANFPTSLVFPLKTQGSIGADVLSAPFTRRQVPLRTITADWLLPNFQRTISIPINASRLIPIRGRA